MGIKTFFLRLWYRRKIKKPHPLDKSRYQLFPLGTEMEFEGRRYRYCKAEGDIKVSELKDWRAI